MLCHDIIWVSSVPLLLKVYTGVLIKAPVLGEGGGSIVVASSGTIGLLFEVVKSKDYG